MVCVLTFLILLLTCQPLREAFPAHLTPWILTLIPHHASTPTQRKSFCVLCLPRWNSDSERAVSLLSYFWIPRPLTVAGTGKHSTNSCWIKKKKRSAIPSAWNASDSSAWETLVYPPNLGCNTTSVLQPSLTGSLPRKLTCIFSQFPLYSAHICMTTVMLWSVQLACLLLTTRTVGSLRTS